VACERERASVIRRCSIGVIAIAHEQRCYARNRDVAHEPLHREDYRQRPQLERKWALYGVLGQHGRVRRGTLHESSVELWQLAVQPELEGIVAKDASAI
ncbi:MAG: hypothetical protein ACXV3D_09965, partial [Halobacteriota archaeon]